MSNELLERLENKISACLEVIELHKLQLEELEAVNNKLLEENARLKAKQSNWELSINSMLNKLNNVPAYKPELVE